MKILFLDIDGVLNWDTFIFERTAAFREGRVEPSEAFHGAHKISSEKVELLNQIVERTGCKIVISSSWRNKADLGGHEGVQEMLRLHGFKGEVIDGTPSLHGLEYRNKRRGAEISQWLKDFVHRQDDEDAQEIWFVILDDEKSDLGDLEHALVQTSWKTGLLIGHVEAAIYHLNVKYRPDDPRRKLEEDAVFKRIPGHY